MYCKAISFDNEAPFLDLDLPITNDIHVVPSKMGDNEMISILKYKIPMFLAPLHYDVYISQLIHFAGV